MKKIYTLITFLFIVIIQCNYAATLTEDFEAVAFTKNAYDVAPAGNGTEDNVTFASGSWRIFDALRGNTAGSDRFNGTQSVRARSNTSIVSMNFDKSGGAGIVSVYAAKYGGDANSTFQFELSTDGGTTWPNVSPTFSLTSTTLTQFTWNANISGNVRIRIVKLTTTSTSNRCNYDDFSITDYTGSVPEINLQQPAGSDSACGMTYNFGTQTIGTNTDVTVRIQNTGTFQLTISGTPITGTNASEFSVFTAPTSPVAASSYTDMTIRFSPGTPGIRTAVLTINSDDADESACIINLTGNANYAPCTELIISEYGEPVVGSGKYIELYNGTSGAINLANYALWRVSNGAVLWSGATVMSPALSGTLAAGSTYVIANNATDVPGANLYNATFCNWNGDDAIGLAKNISGTWYLIDAVGTDMTGYAGTGGWSVAGISGATTDHTLVRKTSVTAPNADWNTSAGSTATNSEWFVRPYQLSNVGCNVNSCSVSSTVGFVTTSTAVTEANTTVTVNATMNSAPTSTVNVKITDALLGTATSGTDYTAFSPVTLVFTPAETYPNTKTFTVSILDDAFSETNELITLDLDAQCGALVSNSRHTITIIDNEIPEGVVINEISQGSANKEYVELVITGTPGTTMDLRGWIIDDNSGIFSGGYGTQLGIAPGHIKFSDICTWEKVPVGSIILLYNASDKNVSITIPDDPTDGNLDYTYVVPIYASATTCAAMATSNLYFSSDCDKPNNVSYDQYTPPVYTNVDWNAMQLRNGGDAVQVRSS
ncbi:MAG TPA: lamin tail domain-containing protein [Chitinophagales bacterium]|nr:lamin tail domain-containing protein [Chitinophagales bacterium]